MVEPEKPFSCSIPDCGMTFTNEDHLNVHTKKHDMFLQLGLEQKAAFVADQTPTPTRFIRNCEEVGLFQELQNVNPFEEGFKRAMETCKHGMLTLENNPLSTSDDLHTPQMFPLIDAGDSALFTSNNHKNITISRSSSDESGTIKEYETTTISKLTNEVTTISRVVNKHDVIEKTHVENDANCVKNEETIRQKDVHNETCVSYTNNVIKIHNNIEIRQDNLINVETTKHVPNSSVPYVELVKKDPPNRADDVIGTEVNKIDQLPPIMSQKSIDFVVDSLTSDICQNAKPEVKTRSKRCVKPKRVKSPDIGDKPADKNDDYEVIIKLPNGKHVRMKAVEETEMSTAKEKLKLALNSKVSQNTLQVLPNATPVHNILPISTGTLIPVTIVNPIVHKVPIPVFDVAKLEKKGSKRKRASKDDSDRVEELSDDDDCVIVGEGQKKRTKEDLNSRVAASRRYRVRLRETMKKQVNDIKLLREANQRLTAEKAALKLLITEHMKSCPNADHLRITQEELMQSISKL